MNLFARRIYYTAAFIVFIILAPIILAMTNGYQWAGWRTGFTPTGVLAISTSPKATILINGQVIDQAVKLTKRLRPGQYEISLERPGYTPWKTLVRIKANTASVFGPVVLFPDVLTVKYQSSPQQKIMTDGINHLSFGTSVTGTGWGIEQLWPKSSGQPIIVPDEPGKIWSSPKGRLVVIGTASKTYITSPSNDDPVWVTAPIDDVFWGDLGDPVFYARREQELLYLDSLTRTETVMATRTSAGWFDQQVWSTAAVDGQTLLYRQPADELGPILVRDFTGPWLIEPGPTGDLLIRNQTDHQTIVYTTTRQIEPLALGVVDHWWWPDRTQPPLWQSGEQLYTLDENNEPILLERGPESYAAVFWIVPRHILVSQVGPEITIRSVSSRQGRGTLLTQKLSEPAELLGVDRSRKVMILRTTETPLSVFTLSWE